MQTMQRFFKFLRQKILTVRWVGYSLQTPLISTYAMREIHRVGKKLFSKATLSFLLCLYY